jgi:hypothetical protein
MNACLSAPPVIDLADKSGVFLPILVATTMVTVDLLEAADEEDQLEKRRRFEETDLSDLAIRLVETEAACRPGRGYTWFNDLYLMHLLKA